MVAIILRLPEWAARKSPVDEESQTERAETEVEG
jgi:hypothetical protein